MRRADHLPSVIVQPRQWGDPGPLGAFARWGWGGGVGRWDQECMILRSGAFIVSHYNKRRHNNNNNNNNTNNNKNTNNNNNYYYYYYYYYLQLSYHLVAVVLTLIQTKQIWINIHRRSNTKNTVQTIQNTVNTSIHITKTRTHTHTHILQNKLKQPQY
jgi:hypothetical protein